MGDKSPKSKQRGKDQKTAAKVQLVQARDKRQESYASTASKEKKR